MKLAPITLSIARNRTGDLGLLGRSNPNVLLLSNFVRPRRIRRSSGNLVARWHISRRTGQLECRWSYGEQAADDHLWSRRYSAGQHRCRRLQQRLQSRCHKPVTMSVPFRFDSLGTPTASA